MRSVCSMRTLSLPFSRLLSLSSRSLRRCISSADESGGSETEYGIAEGGRPIERARGMQSERSRCCHVTERARARAHARPGENAPTHGRQFFRTNVLVRPSSYSSSFPFSSSCSFASCCLSHASYPRLRRVRRLFITRVQTPTSPIFRLFSRMFTRAGKKRPFPFRDVVFIWYPRNSNEDHLTRARARDVQKANRVLKLSRTTGRTNNESQVGPKSSRR